jgi:hypothetical protein
MLVSGVPFIIAGLLFLMGWYFREAGSFNSLNDAPGEGLKFLR